MVWVCEGGGGAGGGGFKKIIIFYALGIKRFWPLLTYVQDFAR